MFVNRSNLSSSLQKHRIVFANLLSHPNLEVSLKSLKLILSCHKPLPDKVSTLMKLCNNSVGFFYKLLHTLSNQHGSKIDGKASPESFPGRVGGSCSYDPLIVFHFIPFSPLMKLIVPKYVFPNSKNFCSVHLIPQNFCHCSPHFFGCFTFCS